LLNRISYSLHGESVDGGAKRKPQISPTARLEQAAENAGLEKKAALSG
jgi:hypothetical protein